MKRFLAEIVAVTIRIVYLIANYQNWAFVRHRLNTVRTLRLRHIKILNCVNRLLGNVKHGSRQSRVGIFSRCPTKILNDDSVAMIDVAEKQQPL